MGRTFFCGLIFWGFSAGMIAQSDSISLNPRSKDFFSEKMASLDSLWILRQVPLSPVEKNIAYPDNPEESVSTLFMEMDKEVPLGYSNIMWDLVLWYSGEQLPKTRFLLSMAREVLPAVEDVFIEEGLPVELKYMPVAASALNPHLRSPRGGAGSWQFTYSAARLYELNIDSYVDQRRDLHLSTRAAAQMLKDLYGVYQDWQLAITAFYCGPATLNRAIRRAGTATDYNRIYSFLPAPQRDLYPAFTALIYLDSLLHQTGIIHNDVPWPPEMDTVSIDKRLHLGQVAQVLQLDLHLLKDINPVYRRSLIPASYYSFELRLPAGCKSDFLALEDSIYHYRDTFFFGLRPQVKVSARRSSPARPEAPTEGHVAVYYTVKPGDNLGFIAQWFSVQTAQLRYWNNIRGNRIRAGQKILIYVPSARADYYRGYDKLTHSQKQQRSGVASQGAAPKTEPDEALRPGEYTIYVVQSGDNPWSIARKYPGVSSHDIIRWNNIDARGLRPGQELKIKKVTE